MARGSYCLLAAVLLALAATVFSAAQITGLLIPAADAPQSVHVQNGALLLKGLLGADALLLLVIGVYFLRQQPLQNSAGFTPLWTPPRAVPVIHTSVPHYPLLLVALLAAALLLRLVGLNSDLWIDEVLTLTNFIRLPLGEIISDYSSDNHHPLFSFLAHLSVTLFGETAWAVRLPSLVFGVASIAAAMQLARLLYGTRVALYTGLLLTLSYHHVWFSQNARGYAILLFGTVLSTWLVLRALQTGRWRYWAGYAVVIALSAWAHITAVFVAIAHALVLLGLLLRKGRLRDSGWPVAAGFLFAAWLTVHLYALMLPQMLEFFSQPGAGTGLVQTEWRSPIWLISEAFRSLGIGAAFGWLGIFTALALAALYAWWFARHDWVVLLLAILPGLLLGSIMFALGRNLWPRMFFNEIGFVLMFIVVALLVSTALLRRWLARLPAWSGDAAVLLLAGLLAASLPAVYRYPKQDFSGARDFVLQQMDNGDRVVGIHMAGRMYSEYYRRDWSEVNSVAELEQAAGGGHTWVLLTLPRYLDTAFPDISAHLQEQYDRIRSFPGTLGDGDILVYRSRSPQAEKNGPEGP